MRRRPEKLLAIPIQGDPIDLRFIDAPRAHRGRLQSGGEHGMEIHGASFVRQRRIVLDRSLRKSPDFDRILIHELFHFAWVRLGNPRRRQYEQLLATEIRRRTRGELGWSAESRKGRLDASSSARRDRKWREYVCESFCDTAACLLAPTRSHAEYTLPRRARDLRQLWFRKHVMERGISV